MARLPKNQILSSLLSRHGTTFSEELGINLQRGTPKPLFQWLCASLLYSTRISQNLASNAARALYKKGWTTAKKMGAASWKTRARVLNEAGYARYDESTSSKLEQVAEILQYRYGGDLRKLREAAGRDPKTERKLLKQFKGMGDTGVDIFFREVQSIWTEVSPFLDKKALQAAKKLDLGSSAEEVSSLVDSKDLPRVSAALVRAALAKDYDDILRDAETGAA